MLSVRERKLAKEAEQKAIETKESHVLIFHQYKRRYEIMSVRDFKRREGYPDFLCKKEIRYLTEV